MSTEVKIGTKKASELMYDFTSNYYKGKSLWDVYNNPSSAKARSWRDIEDKCRELNGENLHITGASCYQYSCMYAFPVVDENGEITDYVLRKETACNTYDLKLPADTYLELIGEEVA